MLIIYTIIFKSTTLATADMIFYYVTLLFKIM